MEMLDREQLADWTDGGMVDDPFCSAALQANTNRPASTQRESSTNPEPAAFVQRLASQNQLLACLRWLGKFQVLALVPVQQSFAIEDTADLAGIPVTQLYRVTRMVATAGFFFGPEPGRIAHTTSSSKFVLDLSFFDAVMFLAESAAPTALQMAAATERQTKRRDSPECAYSLAFNTSVPFRSAMEQQPRLQRRYAAFSQYAGAGSQGSVDLLPRLNWRSLGSSTVVDAIAQSKDVATALASWNHHPRIVLQSTNSSVNAFPASATAENEVTVQHRAPAACQTVKAAAYILQITTASRVQVVDELQAHFEVLRNNNAATLILLIPFVPAPGTVDPNVEASARLWDLSRLQLTNESGLEAGDLYAYRSLRPVNIRTTVQR